MTARTSFRGSFTALVTPFRNGSVDEGAFRRLVDWQIGEGTNGLVPVGTTGESPTLTHDEHKRVVEWCIDETNGRVPVVAGSGSNSTTEAVALSRHAEEAGADAVLIVTPYYNKPTQEGLYRHFKAINDAIGIPIIIYNIPGRSVIDMSVETMKRLFELKNIAGVKDATANVVRLSQQRAALGHDFNQLSGEDATALGFMAHGGHGCISVTSNVAEGRLCGGVKAARQADAAAQRALHRDQSVARQIRPVGPGQMRRDRAPAHGSDRRDHQSRGARCHGACGPDQLRRFPPAASPGSHAAGAGPRSLPYGEVDAGIEGIS
jgi:4-hydroxy-tetrahydrodipicolinate synthase